jgi:hypothetical protein
VIVAAVFTKDQEDMARDLLVSVRLIQGALARVPFVLLLLDEDLPPVFRSPGCHICLLPRDSASLGRIDTLNATTDKECEEFITEFGKPALWDKIVKQGQDLFHNPGKRTLTLLYSGDYQTLTGDVQAFCRSFWTSLDCLDRDASLIGLSFAKSLPEIENLRTTLTRMEGFLSVDSKADFTETRKAICAEREKLIEICKGLENQLKDKGGLSWKTR